MEMYRAEELRRAEKENKARFQSNDGEKVETGRRSRKVASPPAPNRHDAEEIQRVRHCEEVLQVFTTIQCIVNK